MHQQIACSWKGSFWINSLLKKPCSLTWQKKYFVAIHLSIFKQELTMHFWTLTWCIDFIMRSLLTIVLICNRTGHSIIKISYFSAVTKMATQYRLQNSIVWNSIKITCILFKKVITLCKRTITIVFIYQTVLFQICLQRNCFNKTYTLEGRKKIMYHF